MNGPDLLGKLRDSTLQSLLKDKPRPPGDFSSPENRAKLRERVEAWREKYNLPNVFSFGLATLCGHASMLETDGVLTVPNPRGAGVLVTS